jgi:hypothetical protein
MIKEREEMEMGKENLTEFSSIPLQRPDEAGVTVFPTDTARTELAWGTSQHTHP